MRTATFLGAQGRFRDPNPKPNTPGPFRRRQRCPAESSPHAHRRGGAPPTSSPASKNLVMEKVKILKRGELLVPAATSPRRKPDADLALGSTDRLGPDPELVRFQIRVKELKLVVDGTYAGSGFVASPPPSSLPVPGFLGKKRGVNRDRRISLFGEDG